MDLDRESVLVPTVLGMHNLVNWKAKAREFKLQLLLLLCHVTPTVEPLLPEMTISLNRDPVPHLHEEVVYKFATEMRALPMTGKIKVSAMERFHRVLHPPTVIIFTFLPLLGTPYRQERITKYLRDTLIHVLQRHWFILEYILSSTACSLSLACPTPTTTPP